MEGLLRGIHDIDETPGVKPFGRVSLEGSCHSSDRVRCELSVDKLGEVCIFSLVHRRPASVSGSSGTHTELGRRDNTAIAFNGGDCMRGLAWD